MFKNIININVLSNSWNLPAMKVDRFEKVIVKKEDGYYVLSEKTKRNLGGPYKTEEEAKKRLRQVEFFKHQKG
jgi:hypothetical protein